MNTDPSIIPYRNLPWEHNPGKPESGHQATGQQPETAGHEKTVRLSLPRIGGKRRDGPAFYS
ncbi:hypothetical protein [Paenibacillus humicola]|uniref:hypothetical protein n=1 Tax=Paenibacillus humicola TaxID=3110540 RepID=UPI00237B6EF9|nr:hypothetical protein [Paenibacillus humicola]